MALDTKFVRGADRLAARIQTIRATLALPAMTETIGQLLLRRTRERFAREVDPDGRPWEPLAASTLRRKRKEFGDTQILVRTGALRDSIDIIRGDVTGKTFTNTGAGVRIGVDSEEVSEYARVHRRGMRSKNLPVREFLGIGRLDVKAVDSLLRRKAKQIEDAL